MVSQLQDPDPEVRHWAVEGLAYLGTNETIAPLLQAFHDDPSPMVRERAACSLAQSGMLTQEQRHSVIPHLLDYADDASLDTQTHGWVYQALRDITGQTLPNDTLPGEAGTTPTVGRQFRSFWSLVPATVSVGRRSLEPETRNRKLRNRFSHSAILATCKSNPVFGNSDVSSNALKPSPAISVWR